MNKYFPTIVVALISGLIVYLLSLTPATALILGSLIGLSPSVSDTVRLQVAATAKLLLTVAIVLLGLTLQIEQVWQISLSTIWITIISILVVVVTGMLLGKRLLGNSNLGLLLGAGTAICGASAISAVGGAIRAKSGDMAVALGVVLVYNFMALLTFPIMGTFFELSPNQFGVWAGLAIHDTSSVVGAATQFDVRSLNLATTVKLARAVWILPLVLFAAKYYGAGGRNGGVRLPLFLWGFLAASISASYFSIPDNSIAHALQMAKLLMCSAILLLGMGIDLHQVRQVGAKALLSGAVLWLLSLSLSLGYVIVFWR